MNPKSPAPRRESASAPTRLAPSAATSGGTLRRVAPASPAISAPTPVQPGSGRSVAVIAQIPNFVAARPSAQIAAEPTRAVASSPPRAIPSAPPASTPATPLAPTPDPRTSDVHPPTPSTDPKRRPVDRLHWLENLPEWQRLGLQAVVMIAAAILVVTAFAWWRSPGRQADPLPRRSGRPQDVDGELLGAKTSSATSTASVARKSAPRIRPTVETRIPDEAPRTTESPQVETEHREASAPAPPPSMMPPSMSPPSISTPPPTTVVPPTTNSPPSPNLVPAGPVLNSPDRAAYPSYPTTNPQRFQFRVPEYSEVRETAAANPPPVDDYRPSAETARLGEIAPLGSGNIR